jgi:hypothetical protein
LESRFSSATLQKDVARLLTILFLVQGGIEQDKQFWKEKHEEIPCRWNFGVF